MPEQLLIWVGFNLFVVVMLALDLGVFHREAHEVRVREALLWTAMWIVLALLFNLGIYLLYGSEPAMEFLAGYLIEKSLSIDNIFVFLLVFSYFRVPAMYQHKVLFWGILGALITRGIFIFAGVTLIEKFHWIIYAFGAFLIFTGIRMALHQETEIHPESNPVLRLARRLLPISEGYDDGKFVTRVQGRRAATTLLVVLLFIESTDIVFAVDSIPAILAITSDPFIVYTSNVFAILGLRALYFALAGLVRTFRYLDYGLSGVLVFVGIKMLIADVYHVPTPVALGVVGIILLISVGASLLRPLPGESGGVEDWAAADPDGAGLSDEDDRRDSRVP